MRELERIHSFKPIVDKNSRLLILGSVPGPEALRRREYYGFPGNHFWPILFRLFAHHSCSSHYSDKIKLLKNNQIALWDVLESCERPTASDHHIRHERPNDVIGLVKKFRNIERIFLNGRTAEKLYKKYFSHQVKLPIRYLPSTSPAHAAMSFEQKLERWSQITYAKVRK